MVVFLTHGIFRKGGLKAKGGMLATIGVAAYGGGECEDIVIRLSLLKKKLEYRTIILL